MYSTGKAQLRLGSDFKGGWRFGRRAALNAPKTGRRLGVSAVKRAVIKFLLFSTFCSGWPMLQISAEQISLMEKMGLIAKLDKSLGRQYADFAALPDEERIAFLVDSMSAATQHNLRSEQGIASYALAAYWLGVGFERQSGHLQALLDSSFPEVRRVYAMNEWVHTLLGEPENMALADEQLKQAFYRTAAWGRSE